MESLSSELDEWFYSLSLSTIRELFESEATDLSIHRAFK